VSPGEMKNIPQADGKANILFTTFAFASDGRKTLK
jgi:hypothetical protein